jgi:hypothetical protein
MASNLICKAILLFCILIFIYATCKKNSDCANIVYTFSAEIKAYPDVDSTNIGDTLFLELNHPVTSKDIISGREISYSNAANFGTAIGFAEFIFPNNVNTEVAAKFNYKLFWGIELKRQDSSKFREFSFVQINQFYKFKLAIIPKFKGVFKLFVSNAANVYRTDDKCTKAGFVINFTNTNQHLYLNEVSFPGSIPPPGGGIYLFKVK